jgi:hypothetical protein
VNIGKNERPLFDSEAEDPCNELGSEPENYISRASGNLGFYLEKDGPGS